MTEHPYETFGRGLPTSVPYKVGSDDWDIQVELCTDHLLRAQWWSDERKPAFYCPCLTSVGEGYERTAIATYMVDFFHRSPKDQKDTLTQFKSKDKKNVQSQCDLDAIRYSQPDARYSSIPLPVNGRQIKFGDIPDDTPWAGVVWDNSRCLFDTPFLTPKGVSNGHMTYKRIKSNKLCRAALGYILNVDDKQWNRLGNRDHGNNRNFTENVRPNIENYIRSIQKHPRHKSVRSLYCGYIESRGYSTSKTTKNGYVAVKENKKKDYCSLERFQRYIKEETVADDIISPWHSRQKCILKTELEKRGMDTRGSKAELASRLEEADCMKKGLVTRTDVKNEIKKNCGFSTSSSSSSTQSSGSTSSSSISTDSSSSSDSSSCSDSGSSASTCTYCSTTSISDLSLGSFFVEETYCLNHVMETVSDRVELIPPLPAIVPVGNKYRTLYYTGVDDHHVVAFDSVYRPTTMTMSREMYTTPYEG